MRFDLAHLLQQEPGPLAGAVLALVVVLILVVLIGSSLLIGSRLRVAAESDRLALLLREQLLLAEARESRLDQQITQGAARETLLQQKIAQLEGLAARGATVSAHLNSAAVESLMLGRSAKVALEIRRNLFSSLLNAFPNRAELARLFQFGLGVNLNSVTGETNLTAMITEVIQWADSHNCLSQLIQEAHNQNPGNEQLASLAMLDASLLQQVQS